MKLTSRAKLLRKLLFKRNRLIVIDLKSPEILAEHGSDYTYVALKERFAVRHDDYVSIIEDIRHLMFCDRMETARASRSSTVPPLNNGQFGGSDARIGYSLVRHLKPSRIVEIGSGYSTAFFRLAAEDENIGTRIVCIDPSPRIETEAAADEVHRANLVESDPCIFEGLRPNDIVFLDGSHYAFNGTDVPHFFLNTLPVIPKGVYVHVHDIMLPYEYDEVFSSRHYNEQYLLGALLANSESWVPVLPVYYVHRNMRDVLPEFGTSFWMTRA